MTCRPEYVKECKCPDEVMNCIRETLGESLLDIELRERWTAARDGPVQGHGSFRKGSLPSLVDRLRTIDFLHFHVMSGNDDGDVVTLNVHCSLFREVGKGTGLGSRCRVPIRKRPLHSKFGQQDSWNGVQRKGMREMLGIHFEGLVNTNLVFLPEDWDEEIKPWRRDETGPSPENIRELS